MADPSETTQISRGPGAGETAGPDTAELVGAIRELSARVANLQAEVQTLRTHNRSLPAAGGEPAGWDDPRGGAPDTMTWVRALDAPSVRGPTVPRLLLEIVFLVAVAVGAAIAELEVVEIVAVMTVAWVLVALAEWAGARAARQRADAVYAPLPGFAPGYPTDPSWFAPPVERTVLDVVESDEDTETKLPPPGED